MKRFLAGCIVLGLSGPVGTAVAAVEDKAMTQIDAMVQKAGVKKDNPAWRTTLPKPDVATFDPVHKYFMNIQTNKGPIRIQFMPDIAPMHVTNFLYLARLGYFDGLIFHRVIPGFMAQGGDPTGTGSGGPGYKFGSEFSPKARHDKRGILSMAHAGEGTDGSQFFLTFVATPFLDGRHTVFGSVVDGMETLKALEAVGSPSGATSEPLRMEKVTAEVQ